MNNRNEIDATKLRYLNERYRYNVINWNISSPGFARPRSNFFSNDILKKILEKEEKENQDAYRVGDINYQAHIVVDLNKLNLGYLQKSELEKTHQKDEPQSNSLVVVEDESGAPGGPGWGVRKLSTKQNYSSI